MMPTTACDTRILQSLTEEISQTISWLAESEATPAQKQIRDRIRTLREAATVAGLSSVEAALDKLDRSLALSGGLGPDDTSQDASNILGQLLGMNSLLASCLEEKELGCFHSLKNIEQGLDQISTTLSSSMARLDKKRQLIDDCSSAASVLERVTLLAQLEREISEEFERQQNCWQQTTSCRSHLDDSMSHLARELAGLHTLSLSPALGGIQSHVRRLSRNEGKPVSLIHRCAEIRLSAHQTDLVTRVLLYLVDQALLDGIEDPQQRRSAGKTMVGSLRITGKSSQGLTELYMEDDGESGRDSLPVPNSIRQALSGLRGRLVQMPPPSSGQLTMLQFPTWRNSLEVIPAEAASGPVLIPIDTVAEVYGEGQVPNHELPMVSTARRVTDQATHTGGIVFSVGQWQGLLAATNISTPVRIICTPGQDDDPPWVIGWGEHATEKLPILHPLLFADMSEGHICLHPTTSGIWGES